MKVHWDTSWREQFVYCGPHVRIGDFCFFAFPDRVRLKRRVRIDPLCNITCGLECGENTYIGSHSALSGGDRGKVVMADWSFVGSGSRLITAMDDFRGGHGPVGPWGKNLMHAGDILLEPFSGVGVGTTVLPGVELPEGTCIAGMGWLDRYTAEKLEAWTVYACPPGGKPREIYKRERLLVIDRASDPDFLRKGE